MGQGKHPIELWRHLAVAVLYALGFVALREVSFSHWILFAGFRLSALLLVPYRYWPALLVGELGPLAFKAIMYEDRYGALWSSLVVLPPIGLAMPVVRWCREKLKLLPDATSVNLAALLLCTLALSVLWTLVDMAIVATAKLPQGYPSLQFTVLAARWFIGNFLGVLTLTPLVLMVREYTSTASPGELWRRMVVSRFFLETVSILLPALAILVWLALASSQESLRQAARIAMFLPVIWLSLRHGWHGAAIGGSFASIAVVLTMPAKYDAGTLQAQVFIAFAITTMLLLGERIASLNQRERQVRMDAQLALALAQRNMVLGEMQLRQTSHALENVREAVQSTYGQMLDRLRSMAPAPEERDYRLRAAVTQQQLFRLADSLHPVLWRDEGLSAALRQGSIARAMDDCGVRYWCEVRDAGLGELSSNLQIALYRIACETIACACADHGVTRINVRLRAGVSHGRGWAVLHVNSVMGSDRPSDGLQHDDLLLRLSSSGMGMEAVKDRAALFEGRVRETETSHGKSISLILHDSFEGQKH